MAKSWSVERLAAASREPSRRLLWYAEAGLLNREPEEGFAADSLRRVRMIQFARRRGIADEQLAAATASRGDLLGIFGDLAPIGDGVHDLFDAAAELGIDEDLMQELVEIVGWEDVAAGSEEDVAALRLVVRALDIGLPRDALLQLVRVFTDVMDRLADAEIRIFHDHVHEQFRAQGLTGRELLRATEEVNKPALDLVEPAVRYFHHRAWQRANRDDLLRHLTEETIPVSAAPGEAQATVMFIDLASFTPLTEAMGDLAAAAVLRRFSSLVRGTAARHGGRTIKQIGDAFMLVFDKPHDAIRFGLAIDELVEAEPQFPAMHIGAHCGMVLYREGDYVGGVVNLAARVASAGAAGQFLITEVLRDAVMENVDARFESLPPRRLKGLPDPVCLVEVRPPNPRRTDRKSDPVCGMLLHDSDIVARTTWQGTEFVFCSHICEQAFASKPAHYCDAARSH
jgi:adenylate cyclase